MDKFVLKSLFACALTVALTAPAMAQKACDPTKEKCETPPPPTGQPCSPGWYKNHVDFWWNVYCTDATSPTCAQLLTAVACKGADATCGRSAAAAYLNAQSGCTE